ncbi:MAG: nucleoside 2-deoxyribosyltransferase [Bacteroidales bacterium]|nr:nucleoside 2-deoxyribosyltransferase [Bacteroidales bacterium]
MPEKVYFCGSIRGGRSDREIYVGLIQHISQYATVLTEHIGDLTVEADHELTDKQIHDRDMEWLVESDLIIAEVTQVSLGVGYEIGRALEKGKPIVCLYRDEGNKRLSAMISGCSAIKTFHYSNLSEAKEILDTILV